MFSKTFFAFFKTFWGLRPCARQVHYSNTDQKALKKGLRQEIGFQKMLHPNDVRERGHLYKMNYLTSEEFAENLAILLYTEIDSNEGEIVSFPCGKEIMEILTERRNDVPI